MTYSYKKRQKYCQKKSKKLLLKCPLTQPIYIYIWEMLTSTNVGHTLIHYIKKKEKKKKRDK